MVEDAHPYDDNSIDTPEHGQIKNYVLSRDDDSESHMNENINDVHLVKFEQTRSCAGSFHRIRPNPQNAQARFREPGGGPPPSRSNAVNLRVDSIAVKYFARGEM